MRTVTYLVALSFVLPLAVAACGDNGGSMDADPFPTLQACYDEHHATETLSTHDAIVVCCLDHPIAGVHPSCGNSQAECVAHVAQELDSSVTASDIDAACTTYIDQK
jgi:hypothetical protein